MRSVNILVVEDNVEIAENLKKVLIRFGYNIVGIISFGEDALEMVETSNPDIILMDINLAGEMTGIDASHSIQEKYDIPLIFLTANDAVEIVEEATKTNPYAYLLKPFDESELRVNIEMSLYRHEIDLKQKKYNRHIESLHRTADLLVLSKTENEVIDFTVKAAKELCHFDQFAIYKKYFNELDYISGTFRSSLNDPDFKFSKALSEYNYNNEETYYISNFEEFPISSKEPIKFQSAISIKIGNLGVFQIFSAKQNSFSKYDLKLLQLLVGHMNEAMKRVVLERDFREQALKDHLTGCNNRFHLYNVLDEIKKRSQNHTFNIALLMIDLNNLKKINDNKGHLAGDEAIKIVASILTKEIKKNDHVIRYGGDEFLLILDNFEGKIDELQNRIHNRMDSWNQNISDLDFPISFAIGGLKWKSDDMRTLEEALAEVDTLMYENKRKTKKRKLFGKS